MNIVVIGAGYVGLVTSACFAELGNHVTCIDIDKQKIQNLIKGVMPIYEPGLETMVATNVSQERLHFKTAFSQLTLIPDIIFIAVGTPSDDIGYANTQYVMTAAQQIGSFLSHSCVIVDKSTVPVGMASQVENIIQNQLTQRGIAVTFDMASNPEFLREGNAIDDFMHPDRVIVGVASAHAKQVLLDLYRPILRHPERIYFMSIRDAEMTKYAANAMLATRISLMNELAVLCDKMGADIEQVRMGIGSDTRIGSAFLQAGCGYGGSCFPKDVRALIKMFEQHQLEPFILNAVEKRNALQKTWLFEKVKQIFGGDLSSVRVGIWGLSFKPGTDDLREAPSLILIESLLQHGAQVLVYDPCAMPLARECFDESYFKRGQFILCEHQYDVIHQADVLILVTEWQSFCYPDLPLMKQKMRRFLILDGRNQYDGEQLHAAGFEYYGIGRGR